MFVYRVVHTTLVLSMEFFQPFFGYYFFNALLLVLQLLHIFWAYLILRMVYKFMFMGKVRGVIIKLINDDSGTTGLLFFIVYAWP